ncbi:xanthine dehydrogenase small subunit [Rhodoferax lacus]|uniref:Xanthine dehydrogenase small subunit n=1 Tax=Rhodoferax lacus TaxID=2184758 RepID=A0A3E1RE98_9BURK|nr:xanthine dehydrogenase small subunit [Rhodoferax lacus]RFO97689.1 xanthine dehydrogenase small subunit [Rhodoferax lacus]
MNTQPLRFFRRGKPVTLSVETNRTLLDLLREDLHCTGTKEGCGEGDCGACTVVVGQEVRGQLELRAINSCIRLAHSIDGMALWTVEDLAGADVNLKPVDTPQPACQNTLHPVQQAMVQCHGSQCGFCTPGFVMSLFAQYEQHGAQGLSRQQAQAALSGNLCRCTGYRPILDAAQAMQELPQVKLDEAAVLRGLRQLAKPAKAQTSKTTPAPADATDISYLSPSTLQDLLTLRARYPEAQLVAGCTDVGLWVTKMHMQFPRILDTTQVKELRRIERYKHHIAIGAAVTLTDAFAALVADRPQLASFAHRFAGMPVRNSGTLGGNVANGSPIGDSMPLLIALGANVVLMSTRGHRELRLEELYTGYRKNVMARDEVLAWIKIPKAVPQEFSRVYKISKRFEDDISAVCLAVNLRLEKGVVRHASIGVGGVAATPVRARQTEAALLGQAWSQTLVTEAMQRLRQEFSPISDMRASAAYRSEVLGNLLQRFWLESQGASDTSLQTLVLEGAAA